MGDELFDPWFNESDIDLMRHGYDVPRTCFRAGWDLAQKRIAELSECEQCDNHFDTGFCPVCWNALAKRMLDAETQIAECQRERDALRDALIEVRAHILTVHFPAKNPLDEPTRTRLHRVINQALEVEG